MIDKDNNRTDRVSSNSDIASGSIEGHVSTDDQNKKEFTLDKPIALFIYNRPSHTDQVLNRIKQVKPPKLLVVADGPKNKSDQEMCRQTRQLISQRECQFPVEKNFASTNLGLPDRFTTGLDWVFDKVPEAIILEDDIIPEPSFFRFCQVLLDRFRDDNRVMEITGRNQLERWKSGEYDYHFSYYGGIWGWATWREDWEKYEQEISLWNDTTVKNRIRDVIADEDQFRYLQRIYDMTQSDEINSWAYRWGFARHINNGLSVVPSKNLVKNIGFGEGATNTTSTSNGFANKETYEMSFPLTHPPFVAPDREYDRRFHELRQTRSKPRRILDALLDTTGIKKL
ncbi:glycosyltransferase family 2 protein [Haloarcula salina]|uniref:Glycosyltransferase family 2 protein n=1 Tax=Haloarcula salina TaxID=1429914 RepID=A0AA41FZ11_9EURY|nr:glycosyltransferase family 2 protein [Haloarcula salina]MBV0900406.1 hypothetical protein [Haloarcula salina]